MWTFKGLVIPLNLFVIVVWNKPWPLECNAWEPESKSVKKAYIPEKNIIYLLKINTLQTDLEAHWVF